MPDQDPYVEGIMGNVPTDPAPTPDKPEKAKRLKTKMVYGVEIIYTYAEVLVDEKDQDVDPMPNTKIVLEASETFDNEDDARKAFFAAQEAAQAAFPDKDFEPTH